MIQFRSGERAIAAGTDLFSIGKPANAIFTLVSGWAFLYQSLKDSRRQILHFALPGAVLGLLPGQAARAPYGAQALTDCVLCIIPHENLSPLSREVPEIGMRLSWLISHDLHLAFDHLTSVGRRSARERVTHLLLELFVRYRGQWPGNRIDELYLPLTQQHVGDAVGLTAVHVNRILRKLREDGVIEFNYRHLRILDPDKLIDVSGLDPQLVISWVRK
ncbi:MAG: Crp/Fnr family transcriptional regulator [Rhodospirillaceae bacterium]|nr:Crp/Fnr family transcriptional regulator [Rhodospirillaceae bacterium]